ncbi:hypothetical protein OJ253_239 [Cryptosporidium canis]|uniref:Chromatin modification-related protein MEAF6 n=1 Tax=Cryptosporidium canis TaxID=195482 RepID=A0A9D5DQZ7_9CRYT|nr:hypothetical protein OJ253_239 [Cryptosporidium canis]
MIQNTENSENNIPNENQDSQQINSYIDSDFPILPDCSQDLPSHPRLSDEMVTLREKVQDELVDIEKKIYELETFYWNQTADIGNMLRGWDGYAAYNNATNSIGGRKSSIVINKSSCRISTNIFSEKDRWFSLSSVTSPVDIEAIGSTPCAELLLGETNSATGSNVGSNVSHHS